MRGPERGVGQRYWVSVSEVIYLVVDTRTEEKQKVSVIISILTACLFCVTHNLLEFLLERLPAQTKQQHSVYTL